MGRTIYPNLKVVGYDADVITSNVELMKQAGLIKGKTEDFLADFANHANSVLQQEGEGRINPLGKGENELFLQLHLVELLGKNLRAEYKTRKMQHSF